MSAATRAVLDPDLSLKEIGKFPTHRQPKPAAAKPSCRGSIRLTEALKNVLALIFRYTRTIIQNGQANCIGAER